MKPYNVAVFIGSLRKESYARKLAKEFQKLAPASLALEIIEIGDLPLYNQDYDDENQVPVAYSDFRQKVKAMDAFLFITPEYNRTTTPALKNALDIGSRPYGESVWDGKPGAVVSISPGALGGFGANHHVRQSLVFLNVATMQQPEAYIGSIHKLLNEQGEAVDEKTIKYFRSILQAFAAWVDKIAVS